MVFLAAPSSSQSLVVGWSVGRLVGWSVGRLVGPLVCLSESFVKKWPLEYKMLTLTYLPIYLCDSSDRSDRWNSCDVSDSSDSSDSSASSDSTDSSDSSDKPICQFFFLSKSDN